MLPAVRNTDILQCFDAVEQSRGMASGCEMYCHDNFQEFTFGIPVTLEK